MVFSIFTFRHGDQLRQTPAHHTSDELDGFAARVLSGTPPDTNLPGTYPLVDGDILEFSLNGQAAQTVTFNAASFGDIASATPLEISAVLGAIAGFSASPEASVVRWVTDATGVDSSIEVLGGSANDALQFPTGVVTGTLGSSTLVLGHDAPGRVERVVPADVVTVSQSLTFDASRVMLTGECRIPDGLPTGVSWRLSLLVGATVTHFVDYDTGGTFSINDVGFSTAQQAGAATLGVRLAPQGLGSATDLELPAVYIDIAREVSDTAVQVLNRTPYPGQTGVNADPAVRLSLDLASGVSGVAVDATETQIFVDGALAYDGASDTFSPPWNGGGSSATFGLVYNVGTTDARIALESSGVVFDSEQTISIRVVSAHVGGAGAIDTNYNVITADTLDLEVMSAQARDKVTVRVVFNDDVNPDQAVIPSNYIFQTLTVPAVTVQAQDVALVGTTQVDVTVDLELSQGADYRVTVTGVTDTSGNPLSVSFAEFAGFLPNIPDGRSFQLLQFLSADARRRDETGDLRRFVLSLQDVTDLLLCLIDRWTEIIDIDRAPELFVDAILCDLGNPFEFIALSETDKRRLARILLDIYKNKGTEEGLISAIRFLTGITVTLSVLNARNGFWELGVSTLGVNTLLAPPVGSPLWYSFYIDSPIALTAAQRDQITKIATYMKAAHEHILGIREPAPVFPAPSFWKLGTTGLSELGNTTKLGD